MKKKTKLQIIDYVNEKNKLVSGFKIFAMENYSVMFYIN